MDMERRIIDVKLETREHNDESPKIVGYASVFNSLSENLGGFREQIEPGAFDDALGDDVRALFNHDPNMILGRTTAGTLSISSDENGLRYEIDPPNTTVGRDLMVSLQRGDITQSSFGFTVEDDSWSEDDDGRVIRTIHKVRNLFDVSPVTYPAYPEASVSARALDKVAEMRKPPEETDEEIQDETPDDLGLIEQDLEVLELSAPQV